MTVALLALLGIAALVVDIGRLTVVAQQVQNVADSAALAGAVGLPDTQAANTRLQGIVQTNNQETSAFIVDVSPGSDVNIYNPGQVVSGYGVLDDGDYAIEVTCHSTVQYTFARIFGMHQVTVTRSATALSEAEGGSGSGGGGVFFAEESAPQLWGVQINGSHQEVTGDIHSNTRVVVNGSHQTVSGSMRYRHQLSINGAHQDIGDTEVGDIESYPVDYQWDDYYNAGPYDYSYINAYYSGNRETLPTGDWEITGDLSINGTGYEAYDSTFMVDGDIHINGASFEAHNCLFMSEGSIYVNGAQIDFDNSTFIAKGNISFSSALKECSYNRDCDGLFAMAEGIAGVTYNGARQRTEGIIYAPNGPITYNGAHQEVYNGGLAAKTITVNGAHGTFNPHDEYGLGGGSGGERSVSLIR